MNHLAAARAYLEAGRWEQAMQHAERALSTGGPQAEALGILASASLELGRAREAFDTAVRGLGLEPEDAWLHQLAGSAALSLGDIGAAEPPLRRALELAPHAPFTHAAYALVVAAGGRSRDSARRAREHVHRALELGPDDAGIHLLCGDVEDVLGKLGRAEAHYRDALRLDPANPRIHAQLAELLRRRGRQRRAVEHAVAAAQLDPSDRHVTRGVEEVGRPPLLIGAAIVALCLVWLWTPAPGGGRIVDAAVWRWALWSVVAAVPVWCTHRWWSQPDVVRRAVKARRRRLG